MNANGAVVTATDLTRRYGEGEAAVDALRGVSLDVREGELVAVMGPSGSGKSTLMHILAGLDKPTSGSVSIGGETITGMDDTDLTKLRRRRIGFVFQFFNLIPTLTVEENLLLPMELKGKVSEAQRRQARGLLAEVGLADRAGSYPDRLSGGEQQRVAVARALAHDPSLVLADEPTGNLDLETGLQVLDLLDRLTRRAGKTLVMVTHSPEVVGRADRVFRIEDCRLVESTESVERPAGDAG
jgi:putative ABC transport system ATP-binding protein